MLNTNTTDADSLAGSYQVMKNTALKRTSALKEAPRAQLVLNKAPGSRSEAYEGSEENVYKASYVIPKKSRQLELPEIQTKIQGVITDLEESMIHINLQVNQDNLVAIQVSSALVPQNIQNHAQPIWLSVDETSGYERIVITERHEINPLEDSLSDLEEWVAEQV